jgi:hypothetical protein
MPTPTYTPLATVTLGTAVSSVTFGSIPATYRDLVLVYSSSYSTSGGEATLIRVNSDAGSNYSTVRMFGTGSSTGSDTNPNPPSTNGIEGGFELSNCIFQFLDYSATDKHKTVLGRPDRSSAVVATASRWANTAAITSILIKPNTKNFAIGSIFSLYGIEA